MSAAERDARDVVRARADLLLVDVERARSIAPLLPSLSAYLTASEFFAGSPILEARYPRYKRFECVDTPGTTDCNTGITPTVKDYDLEWGPFYDVHTGNASHPSFTAGLSARQLIFDGGRWWTLLARVEDIRDQATAVLKVVRTAVRLNAVRRFYDLAKAQEAVKASELQVRLAEAQLRRARTTLQGGDGKQNEVATAERNLANDRVTLARRQFAASSSGRQLNLAMGRPPETPVAIQVAESVATATIAERIALPGRDFLLDLALQHRAELSQGRAALAIISKNVAIRAADQWPVLSLVAGWSRSSRRPDRIFDDPTDNYYANVGLDLRWSIFSGGTTRASIEEAELELEKARANYEDLERVVKNEVLEQSEELLLLVEVHALNVSGARSAQEAFELVSAAYRQGKATALELRDAELRLTQAILEATVGRFNIEVARAELAKSLGADLDVGPPVHRHEAE